jgi:alpha-beta hydrolase superfamily lysophospholipase
MSAQVAQKKLLAAAQTFKDTSTARVDAASPSMSKTMSLPYLAHRYDQLTALLQMQPLCDPALSSWREAGCVSLRAKFSAAETERKTTLPALITTGIVAMRFKGVDKPLLDAAQGKLDSGDIKGAAILYDAAVRSAEEI